MGVCQPVYLSATLGEYADEVRTAMVIRMSREQFRTPDQEIVALKDRVLWLLQHASSDASDRVLFTSLMNEASARGLSWIQGLEYVVERRTGSPAHGQSVASATR